MGRKNQNRDLGRSLTNRRDRTRATRRDGEPSTSRHTVNESSRPQLVSVLDSTDLQELMENATLANQSFAAERYAGPVAAPTAVLVVPHASPRGEAAREQDRTALRIPRRPSWDSNTTARELRDAEEANFLKWRRTIAAIEEDVAGASMSGNTLTPFEKNIEVWRQLWRVAERSDNVVQIVDARNPLLYFCSDLVRWITEELKRSHTLVINKADLLSSEMIEKWYNYFTNRNIDIIFFSAFKASVGEENSDPRVIGAEQLIDLLAKSKRTAPVVRENQRLVIGMCGYPNVGKSSTINVLLDTAAAVAEAEAEAEADAENEARVGDMENESVQEFTTATSETGSVTDGGTIANAGNTVASKRVAVSATPGRTKHFQTLVLTDELELCDCPGLVFPNFSAGKADLICAGVLSIDQMRSDSISPIRLIARRIPAAIFEGVYGIRFPTIVPRLLEDRPDVKEGYVDAETILDTHARARGFMTAGHGLPDRSRSARVVLRDYVSGRIRFSHPPPPALESEGEAGIGPDVFKKKGTLVIARREAAKVNIENVLRNPELLINAKNAPDPDRIKQEHVVARASTGKKFKHKQFTRVNRPYA